MKILLLNGPPGAGKDTVADILVETWPNTLRESFAKPIKDGIGAALGVTDPQELEDLKRSWPKVRQLMIGISENVFKPILGKDWYATECASRIMRWAEEMENASVHPKCIYAVITDAGFQYEVDAFIAEMLGHDETTEFELWRIVRKGCTFEGDSREWTHADPDQKITIVNNQSLARLHKAVDRLSDDFFRGDV